MIEYSRVKKKNETVQKQRLDELEQQIGSTLQTLERVAFIYYFSYINNYQCKPGLPRQASY